MPFDAFAFAVLLAKPALEAEFALIDVLLLVTPRAVLDGQREEAPILGCLEGANQRRSGIGTHQRALKICGAIAEPRREVNAGVNHD